MSTINDKMTVIADALRRFNTDGLWQRKLSLDEMAVAVEDVYESGRTMGRWDGEKAGRQAQYDEFWDSFQTNYNGAQRNDYRYAFAGAWNKSIFKPKHLITIKGVYGKGLFWCFGGTGDEMLDWREISHMFEFSGITDASGMFDSAMIDYVDIDLFEATNLTRCFGSGEQTSGHTHITLGVSEKCTNYAGAFGGNLTDLVFKEGSVVAANISFANSKSLTYDSLMNIINALKNYSDTATTRTLTLHTNSLALLESTDEGSAALAYARDMKGWTITT